MDYDLSRHLSTRSFEQLIQALAVAAIGPGVSIFGDGPDGGREAIFDGPMAFPNGAAPWNGYLVIQAKFRQRPGQDDGGWALKVLREELEKFTGPERKLRKPEYYLFATNVVLTPVADSGGKDKTSRLLEEYQSKLGLKGFHIWDYDQIRALLDTYPDIRAAYLAWITPGDVLAAVLKQIKPRETGFRRVMSSLLQKDLLADQYVKLGQAGHSEEGKTRLARVFVDLPVGNAEAFAKASAATGAGEEEQKQAKAIEELLSLGSILLAPGANPTPNRPAPSAEPASRSLRTPGRVVLVGGPGQGKSTLGQFLCQLHRVALLDTDTDARLTPEAGDACRLIREQCAAESLSLPPMARFPLRVELNQFATALESEKVHSLFDYLRQHIRNRTEHEIDQHNLRSWLEHWPWLIVLDGLDEVPASSNRARVLDAVQGFLVDAHGCNADLLLVATTRPQGYNDDFSPGYYRHRYLLPLAAAHALHYAERLTVERWRDNRDQQQKITGRLERATKESATARLMQSPLQVTIMAQLVENVGQPPQERWRLFDEYYRVIFQRERQRDIPAAALLNRHETDIHTIHQRVGRRLQAHSERAGGTESVLTQDEFRQLVEQRLSEEGYEGEELTALTEEIIGAALERLVFLVPPREGVIGFEIRSLQEFMAAQWLMEDSDDTIRQRLPAIAPAAHWRNVFLFATGRCFHAKQHLRDSVKALCDQFNEGDDPHQGVALTTLPSSRQGMPGPSARDGDLTRAILLGSRLALEILEDGALGSQPGQLRIYARLALRLLELPPCQEQSRLARQYRPALEAVFQEELKRHLENRQTAKQLGAWRILVELIGMDVSWARGMADTHWPKEPAVGLEILKATAGLDKSSAWLAERWAEVIPRVSPREIEDLPFEMEVPNPRSCEIIKYVNEVLLDPRPGDLDVVVNNIEGVSFSLTPLEDAQLSERCDSGSFHGHWVWQWLLDAEEFRNRPSKGMLVNLLGELVNRSTDDDDITRQFGARALWGLTWPIRVCIKAVQRGKDLNRLARAAEQGMLGNATDWLAAQRRWEESGVTEQDLRYAPENELPFDKRISEFGFPLQAASWSITTASSNPANVVTVASAIELHRLQSFLAFPTTRKRVAGIILFVLGSLGEKGHIWQDISGADLLDLIKDIDRQWLRLAFLQSLPETIWDNEKGQEAIELLGRKRISPYGGASPETGLHLEKLLHEYHKPCGILRFLAAACATGYRPKNKEFIQAPAGCQEPRYQGAALVVRIAQGILESGKAEPGEVAGELAGLLQAAPNANLLDNALRAIQNRKLSGPAVARFLVALFTALPATNWRGRQAVLGAMLDQQRGQVSDAEALV